MKPIEIVIDTSHDSRYLDAHALFNVLAGQLRGHVFNGKTYVTIQDNEAEIVCGGERYRVEFEKLKTPGV